MPLKSCNPTLSKIKCIVLECSMVITDGSTVSDMTVPNICPEDRELD